MKSLLTLLLGVAAVSTGSILVKLCSLSPLTVGAYRLSLALPIFWLWAERSAPGWRKRLTYRQLRNLSLSGLFLGLHFATWIASLSFTTVTSSVVLVTTNPIFVGMGSRLFLGEKVSLRLWVGTLVAFCGTVVVAVGSPAAPEAAPDPLLGNALALVGAVCMSGYLLVGRRLSSEVPTICYVTVVYSVAALTLWCGVLATSSPVGGFAPAQWLLLVLMAFLPQGVGHTLINKSLKGLSPSVVALAILGEPVFASLMAIPIVDEWPTGLQTAGGVAVMAGVGLASVRAPRAHQKSTAPGEI